MDRTPNYTSSTIENTAQHPGMLPNLRYLIEVSDATDTQGELADLDSPANDIPESSRALFENVEYGIAERFIFQHGSELHWPSLPIVGETREIE